MQPLVESQWLQLWVQQTIAFVYFYTVPIPNSTLLQTHCYFLSRSSSPDTILKRWDSVFLLFRHSVIGAPREWMSGNDLNDSEPTERGHLLIVLFLYLFIIWAPFMPFPEKYWLKNFCWVGFKGPETWFFGCGCFLEKYLLPSVFIKLLAFLEILDNSVRIWGESERSERAP